MSGEVPLRSGESIRHAQVVRTYNFSILLSRTPLGGVVTHIDFIIDGEAHATTVREMTTDAELVRSAIYPFFDCDLEGRGTKRTNLGFELFSRERT